MVKGVANAITCGVPQVHLLNVEIYLWANRRSPSRFWSSLVSPKMNSPFEYDLFCDSILTSAKKETLKECTFAGGEFFDNYDP
jgi:hypothetical protein